MPKKSSIRIFDGQTDRKKYDSKSKGPLKNSDQKIIKEKKSKKSSVIFLGDNSKEDELYSSQHYWYRGELMQLVPDALSELINSKEVIVEQKIELMEALTGCETPNRYNVFLIDEEKQKKFLFKCKEESNCRRKFAKRFFK